MTRRGRPIIHWNRYRYDESLDKWIRKKRYKHPIITVVKLDPEQALLVACQTNGAYFAPGGTLCMARGTTGSSCVMPIRTRKVHFRTVGMLPQSQPS